jgi:aspartate racemase
VKRHNFLQMYLPGIYGGVGPLAHIRFEQIFLDRNTRRGARRDQHHPDYILVSAAATPDRTARIIKGETDPPHHMLESARRLEQAGADFMMVICNSAHAFYRAVQEQLSIPWIHLIDITSRQIAQDTPNLKRVGILGTNGSLHAKLHHKSLTRYNITPIAPILDSKEQALVMEAIYHEVYGIKCTGNIVSDEAEARLIQAAEWCRKQGAQAIIPACTEISVALTLATYSSIPIIDPMVIAADVMLELAYGETPLEEYVALSHESW